MPSYSFTVDTEPMARTIDGVSRHVDGVTTAVIAMQTAVVATEKEASNNISRNVNKGFYTLIRSQISQKIARLSSQVKSKFMEMGQQNVSLLSIKNQMERDYMMIGNRYTKLFNSLNKSLKTRIFELDKPTTSFVTNQIEPTVNRLRIFLGKVPVQQTECINTSQVITSSNTKSNALRAINAIKEFINDTRDQKKLVSLILYNNSNKINLSLKVPFAVAESSGLTVQQGQWNYFVPVSPEAGFNDRLNKALRVQVFANMGTYRWSNTSNDEREKVSVAFQALVEKSSMSPRLKNQMMKMQGTSVWQTLKTQGQ